MRSEKKVVEQDANEKLALRRKITDARLKASGLSSSAVTLGGESTKYETIPTGIKALDEALKGGLVKGWFTEFAGVSQSGKSTAAFICAAEVQKLGGRVLFVNAEYSFFPDRARMLGVNIDDPDLWERVDVIDSANKLIDYLKAAIATGEYALVIIDSITALTPDEELDKSVSENSNRGAHARLVSKLFRHTGPVVIRTKTPVILINQIRMKDNGLLGMSEGTTGGFAMEFNCRTRVWFRRSQGMDGGVSKKSQLMDDAGNVVGAMSSVFLQKSNSYGQGAKFEIPIMFVDAKTNPLVATMQKMLSNKEINEHINHKMDYSVSSRVYAYVDSGTGEVYVDGVIDPAEFLVHLMNCEPPSNKKVKDKSDNAFEWVMGRLKYDDKAINELNAIIRSGAAGDASLAEFLEVEEADGTDTTTTVD